MILGRRIAGGVLLLVGVIWLGQGTGVIGGSFMSGHRLWAALGAVCLVVGLVLLARASAARRRSLTEPDD